MKPQYRDSILNRVAWLFGASALVGVGVLGLCSRGAWPVALLFVPYVIFVSVMAFHIGEAVRRDEAARTEGPQVFSEGWYVTPVPGQYLRRDGSLTDNVNLRSIWQGHCEAQAALEAFMEGRP